MNLFDCRSQPNSYYHEKGPESDGNKGINHLQLISRNGPSPYHTAQCHYQDPLF